MGLQPWYQLSGGDEEGARGESGWISGKDQESVDLLFEPLPVSKRRI